jgi:hypothetical protein
MEASRFFVNGAHHYSSAPRAAAMEAAALVVGICGDLDAFGRVGPCDVSSHPRAAERRLADGATAVLPLANTFKAGPAVLNT